MTDMNGTHESKAWLPGISIEDLLARAAFEPPALEDDPAARLLGLVADPSLRFDGPALKRARTKAAIQLPDLVRRLNARGWAVANRDAFSWENGRSGGIAPALIAAVAEIVGVPQRALATSAESNDRLGAVRATGKFGELAGRMARALSLPLAAATARLEASAAQVVHRGDVPDVSDALRSLETLVEELESRGR